MDKSQFENALESTRKELSTMHVGRVTPALIEDVAVEAYDATMKLQELASITSPEPQLLVVDAWDKSVLKNVEAALRNCGRDLSPVVDGEIIRIAFPPLTEEKRIQLTKEMHTKIENGRIAVRKVREEMLKSLKAEQKNGDISEDEYFHQEKQVQEIVDEYNAALKDLGEKKEAELITV